MGVFPVVTGGPVASGVCLADTGVVVFTAAFMGAFREDIGAAVPTVIGMVAVIGTIAEAGPHGIQLGSSARGKWRISAGIRMSSDSGPWRSAVAWRRSGADDKRKGGGPKKRGVVESKKSGILMLGTTAVICRPIKIA